MLNQTTITTTVNRLLPGMTLTTECESLTDMSVVEGQILRALKRMDVARQQRYTVSKDAEKLTISVKLER